MRPIGPRALLAAMALAACAFPDSPQVTAVRFWSLGEVTRVAIETDSEATYHAERIDKPDRLFLDLAGVRRQPGTLDLEHLQLPSDIFVNIVVPDQSGNLWLDTAEGTLLYRPDHTPPHTLVTAATVELKRGTPLPVTFRGQKRFVIS